MTNTRGAAIMEAGAGAMEAEAEDTIQNLVSRCSRPRGRICGAWAETDTTPSAGAGCTTCHKAAVEEVSKASSQMGSLGQLLAGHAACRHEEASHAEGREATNLGAVRCPHPVQRRSPTP